jgi:hypothetical protein
VNEKNLDMYGHPPIPWSRALAQLDGSSRPNGPATTFWLATTGPDGSPDVAGVALFGSMASSTSPAALAPARAGTWPAILAALSQSLCRDLI